MTTNSQQREPPLVAGACRRHGVTFHTAPNRNNLTFCVRCIAAGVRANPGMYVMTDSFLKMIHQLEGGER